MKKIILSLITIVGIGSFSYSQTEVRKMNEVKRVELNTQKHPREIQRTNDLIKHLELNESQVEQMETLYAKRLKELEEAKLSGKDGSVGKEINEKYEKEFKSFLTPEQIVKLDELQDRNRARSSAPLQEKNQISK